MHAMNRRLPSELVTVIIVLGLICIVEKASLRDVLLIWSSAAARGFLKLSLNRTKLEKPQSSLVKLAAKITASLGTGY